jgi:hypothetical protein
MLNLGLDPEVAQALKEYCVRTTGGLKKLSVIASEAVKEYLEARDAFDERKGCGQNPLMALTTEPIPA